MEKKFFLLFFLFLMFFNKQSFSIANKKNIFLSSEDINLLSPAGVKNNFDVEGKSILAVLVSDKKEKELVSQNAKEALPIASITKLMTAIIILENYDLEDEVGITEKAVDTFEDAGNLKAGEKIKVKDLLYPMLIESSNDAAEAFAEKMGRPIFIKKMNEKAQELGLAQTKFFNATGLTIEEANLSSVNDLKNLVEYIIDKHPLISEILSYSSKDFYVNNVFDHEMENTNILLLESKNYLWGKTGYTIKAKGCIVLVTKKPFDYGINNDYVLMIVLGAEDRFASARGVNDYLKDSFSW